MLNERSKKVSKDKEAGPVSQIRAGDKWELSVDSTLLSKGELPTEPPFDYLPSMDINEFELSVEGGHSVKAGYDPVLGKFTVPGRGSIRLSPKKAKGLLLLECVSTDPWEFRITLEHDLDVEPYEKEGLIVTDQGVQITIDDRDLELLQRPIRAIGVRADDFLLSLEAARLSTMVGFDKLLCLPLLRDVEPLEHQLRTAKTILRRFRGRALLCDEVGLGKTIEAGMILLELVARGLVRRVLILTPPSLVEQWHGEMMRKFGLDFVRYDDPHFKEHGLDAWNRFDRILASYHTAKREPHRSSILAREWDMVIIDEAHHFRNRNTLLWRFASELRKRYILLLTATPVQNNLEELFNLVTLLQPGLLSTSRSFQREFVDRRDKITPKNIGKLHELLSEVMVRNRRSSIGIKFTRRYAQTQRVVPSTEEMELYREVSGFVKGHLRNGGSRGALSRMALITLQKEMGSSSSAAAPTIEKLASHKKLPGSEKERLIELAQTARKIEQSAKAEQLLKILSDFPDKIVVFTQFRETQNFIHRILVEAGERLEVFHGGMSRLKKEEAIERFRKDARILLSTESGSEGRNLQFCNAICNFDLPWNPMRIEQRVGRLSRIGQTRDVYVFNLVASGTIEDAILYLLEAKINMFELVIGEIDMVLGNLKTEKEFDDLVAELWAQSEDEDDFISRMEELGKRLQGAKEAYLWQREYDDKLFGDKLVPEG